jgi:hypothetical protein
MDQNKCVEEEHWNLVTTLAHMLKSFGHKRTCGTQLEDEHLAKGNLDSGPSCKREPWTNSLLERKPSWRSDIEPY